MLHPNVLALLWLDNFVFSLVFKSDVVGAKASVRVDINKLQQFVAMLHAKDPAGDVFSFLASSSTISGKALQTFNRQPCNVVSVSSPCPRNVGTCANRPLRTLQQR